MGIDRGAWRDRFLASIASPDYIEALFDRLPDIAVRFGPDGPGRYVAQIAVPRPGQWEARVVSTAGADRFDLVQRVFVP